MPDQTFQPSVTREQPLTGLVHFFDDGIFNHQ
jgi:hypothetical protein